jgi:hypothetical protein
VEIVATDTPQQAGAGKEIKIYFMNFYLFSSSPISGIRVAVGV